MQATCGATIRTQSGPERPLRDLSDRGFDVPLGVLRLSDGAIWRAYLGRSRVLRHKDAQRLVAVEARDDQPARTIGYPAFA